MIRFTFNALVLCAKLVSILSANNSPSAQTSLQNARNDGGSFMFVGGLAHRFIRFMVVEQRSDHRGSPLGDNTGARCTALHRHPSYSQ